MCSISLLHNHNLREYQLLLMHCLEAHCLGLASGVLGSAINSFHFEREQDLVECKNGSGEKPVSEFAFLFS